MDKIAKFSILDGKTEFTITILDGIWTKKLANGQQIAGKIVKFFHVQWLYHNVFTVGLKERMPIIIGTQMA